MNDAKAIIIDMSDVTVPARHEPDDAVIEHVNWRVAAGEFWIVGGLQGSGKSDFIMLAAGLAKPLHGTYRLFGEEMTERFGDELLPVRMRVGVVFDLDGRLFTHLSVLENVTLPLRYHQNLTVEDAEVAVNALLEATQLTDFKDAMPTSLSRNWRIRVALARALALQPQLLLLDNPLAALDPRHVQWWIDFLRELNCGHALLGGRPVTIVATADDLRPWKKLSSHCAMLDSQRWLPLEREAAMSENDEAVLRVLGGEV